MASEDQKISAKGNRKDRELVANAPLSELRKYYHLPVKKAASKFNVGVTYFKEVCRKKNISKWPYRQMQSMIKSIDKLESAASLVATNDIDIIEQYRNNIQEIKTGMNKFVMSIGRVTSEDDNNNNLLLDDDDDNSDNDLSESIDENNRKRKSAHSFAAKLLAEGQQGIYRLPDRVKKKPQAISRLIQSIDKSTSRLIKMQRLSNEESNKAGAQDQSAVAFVSPQNLTNLTNQCDEAQATLSALLGKLHAARVLAGDPSVRNPMIQVLYYDGNKAVHFLKGGPEEEGFPMSQSLFQAHTIGVIDSVGERTDREISG